jgi:hypothetical protein
MLARLVKQVLKKSYGTRTQLEILQHTVEIPQLQKIATKTHDPVAY